MFEALEVGRQRQQIIGAKEGASLSKDDEGVGGHQAGPGRREPAYMPRRIVKGHAIGAPMMVVIEDLKLLPVQGMKGMGDREHSVCQRGRRCS